MRSNGGRRQWLLDATFLAGIGLKGIDGFVELVIGLPLLFLRPWQILALAQTATAGELRADPDDLVANLVLHGASQLSSSATLLAAVYLIVHGLVKLVIVVALVRGSRRVYPWAIGALTAFLVAQLVQLALTPSIGVAVLSVLDAAILWLTWREWRHGRTLRDVWRSLWRRSRSEGRTGIEPA